jgi:hypothetical protein
MPSNQALAPYLGHSGRLKFKHLIDYRMAACAAASRAIGTLKGEQLT